MKNKIIERINFGLSIFTKRELPPFYDSIYNAFNNELIYPAENKVFPAMNNKVLAVENVPDYFKTQHKVLPEGTRLQSVKFYPGFLINFEGIKNLDEYLNSRFGKSSRYKLRRDQKKLEQCFDISYKMYFGEISKKDYENIMDEFYKLLRIRSTEKGIKNNRNLKTKDYYRKIVFPMILEKKASLFVIYNGSKPIDICLNYHLGNVIFQFIRTYDINYSKFNTGYIDLMKQIEWCIANKIKIISFSYGDYYWKRRWCNTVYDYKFDIFYDSTSLRALLVANFYSNERRLKQILRKKNIIERYHNLRSVISKYLSIFKRKQTIICTQVDYNNEWDEIEKIDFHSKEYSFLIRSVYEFLYITNEQEKYIEVSRILNVKDNYLVVGRESKQLISIK